MERNNNKKPHWK